MADNKNADDIEKLEDPGDADKGNLPLTPEVVVVDETANGGAEDNKDPLDPQLNAKGKLPPTAPPSSIETYDEHDPTDQVAFLVRQLSTRDRRRTLMKLGPEIKPLLSSTLLMDDDNLERNETSRSSGRQKADEVTLH